MPEKLGREALLAIKNYIDAANKSKEDSTNKTVLLSDTSTDVQYPSAKAVVDYVATNNTLLAPTYDATSTYAVGDAVTYNNQLYQCIVAIETAEAWDATHWQAVTVADLITGSISNVINRGY